ncbi:hypothetical protein D3C77_501530 [compost metagenome]
MLRQQAELFFHRDEHFRLAEDRRSHRVIGFQAPHAVDLAQRQADVLDDKAQDAPVLQDADQRGDKHDGQQNGQEERDLTVIHQTTKDEVHTFVGIGQ